MPSNRSLLWIALVGAALIAVIYYFGMRHAAVPAATMEPAASLSAAPSAAVSDPAPVDQTADAAQQPPTEKPKLPGDGEWVDGPAETPAPKN